MVTNNLLSEQLAYSGDSRTATHLHLCTYNPARLLVKESEDPDEVLSLVCPDAVNWVEVHGLNNTDIVIRICQAFGVDILTMQDILNVEHRPKIEQRETYNVAILKYLIPEGDTYRSRQMSIVQGKDFVLTFTEEESGFWNDIRIALERDVMKIRQRPSDYLLSVLLNSAMMGFMSLVSVLEDELEEFEERLLVPDGIDVPGLSHLQAHRRHLRLIKKCVSPFKEELGKLTRDAGQLLHPSTLPFLSDVNDHLQFVLQTLDGCRDTITALVDICLSNNDRRMNGIMKQLTVVSSIFIPLTFLAGIWGMNFRVMPELDWQFGYLFAWGLMAITAAGVWGYIKRKRWN